MLVLCIDAMDTQPCGGIKEDGIGRWPCADKVWAHARNNRPIATNDGAASLIKQIAQLLLYRGDVISLIDIHDGHSSRAGSVDGKRRGGCDGQREKHGQGEQVPFHDAPDEIRAAQARNFVRASPCLADSPSCRAVRSRQASIRSQMAS